MQMKLVKNANYQGNAFSNSIFVAAKHAAPLNWCRDKGRDIHIECSKQFKWNLYFYVSGQSWPFWAVLKLL